MADRNIKVDGDTMLTLGAEQLKQEKAKGKKPSYKSLMKKAVEIVFGSKSK